MEFTPTVAPATQRNVPHELQARLYREVGVAAVAAALGISDVAAAPRAPEQHATPQAA